MKELPPWYIPNGDLVLGEGCAGCGATESILTPVGRSLYCRRCFPEAHPHIGPRIEHSDALTRCPDCGEPTDYTYDKHWEGMAENEVPAVPSRNICLDCVVTWDPYPPFGGDHTKKPLPEL